METKKINTISLFSGIGAFEKALTKINLPYNLINYCEWDKFASKSYSLIHSIPESFNLWDITQVREKELPTNVDLLTYGFPCQDISTAGTQKGLFNDDGTKTRSGLFFDALRIIKHAKPKIAIAENVKALTQKKFKKEFKLILSELDKAGYNNYYNVINASDFNTPQNRERIIIVSIRKDIDDNKFVFPSGNLTTLVLNDILEKDVREKYYLAEEVQKRFKVTDNTFTKNVIGTTKPPYRTIGQRDNVFQRNRFMGALVATDYKQPKQVIEIFQEDTKDSIKRYNYEDKFYYNIRHLTPLECFRLMTFDDRDCLVLMKNKVSDCQLYKQAGNSISVSILEPVLNELKRYFYL